MWFINQQNIYGEANEQNLSINNINNKMSCILWQKLTMYKNGIIEIVIEDKINLLLLDKIKILMLI